jgi:hypothetical protein
MKKLILLFITTFYLLNFINAQTYWGKSYGGFGWDFPRDIEFDGQNEMLTVGVFAFDVDFDPGESEYILPGGILQDVYIQKLNSEGEFIWAKALFGDQFQDVGSIIIDSQDNIYILGSFAGIVDFNPGPNEFLIESNGLEDLYVLKLSSEGEFQW